MMPVLSEVDDVVLASRALLAIVARTIAPALEAVSLPQFRVLVVLVGAGPHRVGALAERLDALPSTFSRALDRLEQGGWVERVPSTESRREVIVEATERARRLVGSVTEARRHEVATVLDRMPSDRRAAVVAAFREFADAADEPTLEDLLPMGG
jgi:DNA-binding MarR family transcriptional regulator